MTMAEAFKNRGVHPGSVEGATRTSPGRSFSDWLGWGTNLAVPEALPTATPGG